MSRNQESSESDHADGDIDLEEGEIEDDEELNGQNVNDNTTDSNSNSDKILNIVNIHNTNEKRNKRSKHRDKKKRKKQQRMKAKSAEIAELEIDDVQQPMQTQNLWNFMDQQPKIIPNLMPTQTITQTPQPLLQFLPIIQQSTQIQPLLPPPPTLMSSMQQPAPVKTLFDLFSVASAPSFIDPTITEKENNKPPVQLQQLLHTLPQMLQTTGTQQQQQTENKKRKSKENGGDASQKYEKKRKYIEAAKEKQKREIEWKEKCSDTICRFFLSNTCTKGDDCPYSHDPSLITKKPEICKFYLSGYCGKNEKCIFMHTDFPCKFFHTGRGECTNIDNCRFSHAPLNDLTKLALEKYLKELNDTSPILIPQNTSPSANLSTGVIGSPSRDISKSIVNSETIPAPLPSLMNLSIPKVTAKPSMPSPLFCQDIDERYVPTPVAVPSIVTAPSLLPSGKLQSFDIDERSVPLKIATESITTSLTSTSTTTATSTSNTLLTNILETTNMDPSNLLAKLLNSKDQTTAVSSLINTLTSTISPPLIAKTQSQISPPSSQQPLQTDSVLNKFLQHLLPTASVQVKEESKEESVEIDARTNGQLPYILYTIDVEPSSLWSTKPLINTSLSNTDQEFDPRIEFYSNIANFKQKDNQTSQSSNLNQAVKTDPRVNSQVTVKNEIIEQNQNQQDLIQIHNRTNIHSLLSSLPDFIQPKAANQQSSTSSSTQASSSATDSAGVVKLSIEDYKRKLQRPIKQENGFKPSPPYITDYQPSPPQHQPQQQKPQMPKIPSYSIGLDLTEGLGGIKTPQSLHELLKNFPS